MANRFVGPILGALLAFSCGLLAQTPAQPRGANATPDFSGIWSLGDPSIATGASPFEASIVARKDIAAGRIPSFGFSTEEPPMQPWAAAKYKAERQGRSPHEAGPDEDDPIMYPYCIPHGFPRIYTSPFAFEIAQTPTRIFMIFESGGETRRIYLDGKKHLEGWAPSPLGISNGRWDGDTLVVETDHLQSLDRFNRLDSFGHPYTDALRVTERIRRPSPDVLQVDFLFDDPGAYTRPWPGRKLFERKDWDIAEARTCENHQTEDYLRDMKAGKPAGRE
jgi:hypothetical protein